MENLILSIAAKDPETQLIGITLNIGDGQYDLSWDSDGQYDLSWETLTRTADIPDQDPSAASVDFNLGNVTVIGTKEGTELSYLFSVADEAVIGLDRDTEIFGHSLILRGDGGTGTSIGVPAVFERADYVDIELMKR